jgi:hypothetical protein
MEYFMKKSNIVINNSNSVEVAVIQKMDFDGAELVHNGLFAGFHPDGLEEDEEIDSRFLALWNLFLASVGWSNDEFWAEHEERYHAECSQCAEEAKKVGENNSIDKDPSKDSN